MRRSVSNFAGVIALLLLAFVAGTRVSAQQSAVLTVVQTNDPDLAATIQTSPSGVYGLCLSSCRGTFPAGSTVTITASTAGGTWGGACAGQQGRQCTLLMDRDRNVAIAYGRATLTLKQSHDPSGLISVNPDPLRTFYSSCRPACRETYARGTVVTLRPQYQPGMNPPVAFDHWEGACANAGETCVLPMTGDKNVDVVWRDLSTPPPTSRGAYSVRIRASMNEMTFKMDPPGSYDHECLRSACVQHYDAGTRVTITALPSAWARLDHWEGVCAGQGPTCSFVVQGDTVVSAMLVYDRT
jgi:hypothetical protein